VTQPFLRRARGLAAAAAFLLAFPALAADSPADLAKQSVNICHEGREAKDRNQREALFTRGQTLAEEAIKGDDNLVDGHYGMFCNLGELLRLDGEKITSVFKLRRLMAEIDRTLELDPHHLDALATKGTLLMKLPSLLGGDPPKGEKMLREVVKRDDNALTSRLTLARTLEERGDKDEALPLAQRALQIARAQGRTDKIAECQAVLTDLGVQQ
jgi:tetratricopeptide (TPR) repeat protein